MLEKIETKLKFLKEKKEEYISQVIALNGAIQALEELIKGEEHGSNNIGSSIGCDKKEYTGPVESRPDQVSNGPGF